MFYAQIHKHKHRRRLVQSETWCMTNSRTCKNILASKCKTVVSTSTWKCVNVCVRAYIWRVLQTCKAMSLIGLCVLCIRHKCCLQSLSLVCVPLLLCLCVYMHTHVHICNWIHIHVQAYIQSNIFSFTHAPSRARVRALLLTCARSRSQTFSYTRTNALLKCIL